MQGTNYMSHGVSYWKIIEGGCMRHFMSEIAVIKLVKIATA